MESVLKLFVKLKTVIIVTKIEKPVTNVYLVKCFQQQKFLVKMTAQTTNMQKMANVTDVVMFFQSVYHVFSGNYVIDAEIVNKNIFIKKLILNYIFIIIR